MTGAGLLLRHFLRRDRWQILVWAVFIAFTYVSQAVGVDEVYADQAEFDRAAASMSQNTAFIAMLGPARALNTLGGQVTWQASAFGVVLAGLMSMFLIGRHTRREEESGRDELLRAAPVARFAPMSAALGTALIANAVVGAMVTLALVGYGLAFADSLALGVGLMLCGWLFSGVTLVAVQLTSGARAAYALTGILLGVAYVLRAVGDVSAPALSWLSPIGWYQATHAFSGVRWWPLLPALLATVAVLGSAYALFTRRDYGAGMWPDRPGPGRAGPGLRSGLGLAWHLQRGAVIGWSLGLLLLGFTFGTMGKDVGDLLGDSEVSRDIMAKSGGDLVDAFFSTSVLMLAVTASGFAVASALRPRSEEDDGRVDALLSTGLSRGRWLAGHVLLTVLGTTVVVVLSGVGLAVGYLAATGESEPVATYVVATLGWVVPVLVLASVARLLHGWVPRLAGAAWLLLGFSAFVVMFGEVLSLPRWVQDLSPFEHLALVPSEPFRWTPVLLLAALAITVSGLGQLGLRRRDLA